MCRRLFTHLASFTTLCHALFLVLQAHEALHDARYDPDEAVALLLAQPDRHRMPVRGNLPFSISLPAASSAPSAAYTGTAQPVGNTLVLVSAAAEHTNACEEAAKLAEEVTVAAGLAAELHLAALRYDAGGRGVHCEQGSTGSTDSGSGGDKPNDSGSEGGSSSRGGLGKPGILAEVCHATKFQSLRRMLQARPSLLWGMMQVRAVDWGVRLASHCMWYMACALLGVGQCLGQQGCRSVCLPGVGTILSTSQAVDIQCWSDACDEVVDTVQCDTSATSL